MILLNVAGIRRQFGPEPVLSSVTFEVRPGDRIGLVGPNGSGKTTLLRILAGKDEADAGSCEVHAAAQLGYLEQQPHFEADRTLHGEALSALADLVALQQEALEVAADMAAACDPAEQKRLAARYDHLQHELHEQDAYNIDHRLERVLDGLRFRRETFDQPVASLSGGEQNRLMLAKLLLAEPNLMILDEPSNHLDIEATEWLEDFSVESSAAMLVVSHDRYFLDKVTNRTLELFHGTVDQYTGNFSAYWQQKAERLLVQRRTYEKQQIEIEKTKDFIRRNAYGQKHAQAEDRRKKLERIELVTAAARDCRADGAFSAGQTQRRHGGPGGRRGQVLRSPAVQRRVGRHPSRPALGPAGTQRLRQDHAAALPARPRAARPGEDQAGHRRHGRLFRSATGRAGRSTGRGRRHPPQTANRLNEQQRRDLLAGFGLTGDRALQPVGSLSGGERCRAALARLAAAEANFLVLDEPTNHLDLWARDALENALLRFHGTVLFVSHDRYFVNRVADHVLAIEPGRAFSMEGNYDSYQARSNRPAGDGPDGEARRQPEARSDKPAKQSKPSAKKRRFPYRKVTDLEHEIFERETCIESLQSELAQPEVLRDGERVREVKLQIEQEQAALKGLYEHWEEATELNW